MDTSRFRKKDSRKQKTGKAAALVLSFLLLTAVSAGGTIAYISTKTDAITNTFDPSHVSCEATETFDGTVKSNVNVTNTGDIDAWLRVKLVTYRVNEEEQHIGGIAKIPDFTPGEVVRAERVCIEVEMFVHADPYAAPCLVLEGDPSVVAS